MNIEKLPNIDIGYFHNMDKPSINVWKQEYEAILMSWRKLSAINMWLSLASKHMFEKINNWLTYPSIIISVFMSIGIIGLNNCSDGATVETYVLASLTLIAAILTTINKHLGAAEKSHEFYVRSKEYYALIREIDYILALNIHDRPEVFETIVRMRADLEKIIDNQMDFPLHIIQKYETKYKSLESSLFVDLESEKKRRSHEFARKETINVNNQEENNNLDDIIVDDIEAQAQQSSKNSQEATFSPRSRVDNNGFSNFLAKLTASIAKPSKNHTRKSFVMMPYQLHTCVDITSPTHLHHGTMKESS